MKFNIITCVNTNLVLGDNNDLLYKIPNDLANFKRMTNGNVIIMGRKTFESLPNSQPLKNRINIIITNDTNYSVNSSFENVHIVHSIEDAKDLCEAYYDHLTWYVIGGGQIYQEFISRDWVKNIYITTVNDNKEGDTFFPNVLFGNDDWELFYQSYTQRHRPNNLTYIFSIYQRNVKNH